MTPEERKAQKMVEIRAFMLSDLHTAQQGLVRAHNHARMRGDTEVQMKVDSILRQISEVYSDVARDMAVTEGRQ